MGVLLGFAGGGAVGGFISLVVAMLGVPILVTVWFAVWPYTPLGRNLVQPPRGREETLAALPELRKLEELRGRYGKTVSTLRPAGVVEFDGRRIDTIAESGMVEPGTWVRCIDVRAGKVVVRPAEPPRLEDLKLETEDFS